MKKTLFIILIFTTLGFTKRDTVLENKAFKIAEGSRLSVIGTSNVKGFTCKYDVTKFDQEFPVNYTLEGDKIVFSKSDLVLENINFNCGGRGINRDFREILKTNAHPQIKLTLKEIINYKKKNQVEVIVDISMAGVSNPYHIPVVYKTTDKLEVSGHLELGLKDFKIEAPSKLFGIVQIGNEVKIEFQLFLEAL